MVQILQSLVSWFVEQWIKWLDAVRALTHSVLLTTGLSCSCRANVSTQSLSMELYCFLQKFSSFYWVSYGTQDFSKKKCFSLSKEKKKGILDTPINRIFLFKQHSSTFHIFHLTLVLWGLQYGRALYIFSPQLSPQYLVFLAMGLKINICPSRWNISQVETEVNGIIYLLLPHVV